MNLFLLLILLSAQAWALIQNETSQISYATEDLYRRRGELLPPPSLWDMEEQNQVLFNEFKQHQKELRQIKFHLINGDVRLAKLGLSKLTQVPSNLRPVILRYQGILAFIEGDHAKSFEFFARPELKFISYNSKVCVLQVLNQIILGINKGLEDNWGRCRVENADHFQVENFPWVSMLVDLRLSPYQGITQIPFQKPYLSAFSNTELKIFLKLALYLNQDALLIPRMKDLDLEQLKDPEIREIVGHIYFRNGFLSDSFKFIEDLKSPNAENIKGNFYILRDKYELAYAQFKLALEQKQNSQNAVERLLPLAWLLGDWENGVKYAERVMASPQTLINKLTLNAAFLMQKGDMPRAQQVLDSIADRSFRGQALDVTQIYSFVALMQNRPHTATKNADLSCAQYDVVNCWLLFQMVQWDNFPLVVRREDKVEHKKIWENLIKEEIDSPLKETVYVNQIDIEELDDRLIQLIPGKNP